MAAVEFAPEAIAEIQAARDALKLEAERLASTNDPSASSVACHALGIEAMGRLITDATLTMAYELNKARKPPNVDEMRRAVLQGLAGHMPRILREMRVRTILMAAGMLVLALLVGGGFGYWIRGGAPTLVGVRAGADMCTDQADGSRICWIPIWDRLPRK